RGRTSRRTRCPARRSDTPAWRIRELFALAPTYVARARKVDRDGPGPVGDRSPFPGGGGFRTVPLVVQLGADVEQLDQLARTMDATSQRLAGAAQSTSASVASVQWLRPGARAGGAWGGGRRGAVRAQVG